MSAYSMSIAKPTGFVGDSMANNMAFNPNAVGKYSNYGVKMNALAHVAPKGHKDTYIATYQEEHIHYRNPVHSAALDALPKATKLVYVTLDGKRRVYHYNERKDEYDHAPNDPDNLDDYSVKPIIDIHHYQREHMKIKEERMEKAIERGGYSHDEAMKLAHEERQYYTDSLHM